MNLHCCIVVIMFLDPGAAFDVAHSPIAARQMLQHIDTDPDPGMLKCGLEDRRHRAVGHQGGSVRYGGDMLPGLLAHQDAA